MALSRFHNLFKSRHITEMFCLILNYFKPPRIVLFNFNKSIPILITKNTQINPYVNHRITPIFFEELPFQLRYLPGLLFLYFRNFPLPNVLFAPSSVPQPWHHQSHFPACNHIIFCTHP